MKKILFIALSFLLLSDLFISCKKTETTVPVNPIDTTNIDTVACIQTTSLHVQLLSDTVVKNGFDYVSITVLDDAGNNVTRQCNLYLNDVILIDSIYVPSSLGNQTVTAKIPSCNIPSNQKVFTVIASDFIQKILVEDLTGTWCGYCPRVAFSLDEYKPTHPNCISTTIHGGSNSDPMCFQYYSTFNSRFAASGYPTAILNRKKAWSENTADLTKALENGAPLALSISSDTSGASVTATIKVKFGVTTSNAMKIVIAVVENGIIYPQDNYYSPSGGATPYLYNGENPITNFVHNGVLRKTVTDLFGDVIPQVSITKGNEYTVTKTIPLSGNTAFGTYSSVPSKCGIVAFVVDGATNSPKGLLNVQYADLGADVGYN